MNVPTRPAQTAEPTSAPARARPMLRRYQANCLGESGEIIEINRLAPAASLFEQPFNALARGTLLSGRNGSVAIEDILPGDHLDTAEEGSQKVLWIGQITVYPTAPDQASRSCRLIRLTADALGYGRPVQDLITGPGARLWSPAAAAFRAPEDMLDGETIIELTPVAPVTLYQLCLAGGRTVLANGLAVQSYMAETETLRRLAPDMLALFLSMFPNPDLHAAFGLDPRPKGPKDGIAA